MGFYICYENTQIKCFAKESYPTGCRGSKWLSHCSHLQNPKMLKIDQIGILQIGEFMYRFDRNLLPSIYKHYFQRSSQIHPYFTRNSSAYRHTYARTNTRLFSIKSIGVAIWEKIAMEIRLSPASGYLNTN